MNEWRNEWINKWGREGGHISRLTFHQPSDRYREKKPVQLRLQWYRNVEEHQFLIDCPATCLLPETVALLCCSCRAVLKACTPCRRKWRCCKSLCGLSLWCMSRCLAPSAACLRQLFRSQRVSALLTTSDFQSEIVLQFNRRKRSCVSDPWRWSSAPGK